MANWVLNNITVYGKKENMAKFLKDIDAKENGEFKFELILPMPEELKNCSSNLWNVLRYAYENNLDFNPFKDSYIILFRLNSKLNYYSDRIPKDEFAKGGFTTPESKIRRMVELIVIYGDDDEYDSEDGKKQYENYCKYGAFNSHIWKMKNYGCKWDCSDGHMNAPIYNGDMVSIFITFCTPWNMPLEFLSNVAYKYNLMIHQEYADEDMGVNCGTGDYNPIANVIHDTGYMRTDESEKFAKKLWG